MDNHNNLLLKARIARKESKAIDFKESFNTDDSAEWIENIKDIIAMANSGGGILIYGVKDNGLKSNNEVSNIYAVDPAIVTDKIKKYTNYDFSEFQMIKLKRKRYSVPALVITEVDIPIVFTKPGTYKVTEKKQKTVFSQGTTYFRHGAKSEPGNTEDIRKSIDRCLKTLKR